ncbi:extracellular solute-binding protein [Litorilinea aerophila]|uniref:Extracellular solute-binding protein n=1 Tax=Litorilinea aerophila TaxID=1204385 RepID=A0A540VA09_9CHLR|nr:extracellular solute-binding protein [Litorilinea aerophila]MCC9078538.1 extracellular solute-binding protein [Litorilinea aerophila]GIV79945.1 MAG: ABC transporter substrate-binding protein [Litorilinea sp.]
MKGKLQFLAILLLFSLLAACAPQAAPEGTPAQGEAAAETEGENAAPQVSELKILWAQWDPADYLQQIGNLYEQETGIKVSVIQEPWGSFGDRFFTEMAASGDAWDIVVGDSQWLGQGATQGHYIELTDFLVSTGIADSVTPATLTYYGEYPTGSGRYWAYPTEGDALGWAYRKDLFENPENKAAFQEQYGYELDVPQTFEQLMDIAKFFTRPEEGLYGVAIYTQKDYDAITMGMESVMFSYGGDWKDEDYNVMGVVNSPENVAAVQYYKELYDCCQVPGLSNAFFTEANDALISGQAALIMNYFAFFPALASSGINPYADVTGYFPNPAGPGGAQHAALGGQGMSIISYISPERQEAAKAFIQWFAQEEIQMKWAELGGYTCNANVLQTDAFLNATPFNPAFATSMTMVKDFWNIPEYGQLLEVTQREFSRFVVEGQGTAQETMDTIAAEHDRILRQAGYLE